jgi:hypothetical protein
LKTLSEHQCKEHALFGKQNKKLQKKYNENFAAYTKLQSDHEAAVSELEFLRKKDEVFAEADKELEVFRQKILALEREIERQKGEIDEYDFNNRTL